MRGQHLCHQCNKDTFWVPIYSGSPRMKCSECGDIYPCRLRCEHLDCKLERSSWRKKEAS